VEDLRVLVGDEPSTRSDIGGNNLRGVVRRLVERPDRGVRAVPGITQAVVVRRLAAPEVGVETLGGKTVEAPDRLLQRAGRDLHLSREFGDGLAPQDRASFDQLFGEAALLERV